MTKEPNRRRRILIDELQYRLLAVNVTYFFLILLAFVSALFAPLLVPLLSSNSPTWVRSAAAEQFLWLDESIWLPLLLTFVALAAHSTRVSHRIVGPLYQLRRILRAVADGNLSVRAVLREKDYLRKEEAAVNEMIEKLGGRIAEIKEQDAQLHASLKRLRAALDSGSIGEARERLGSVDESAKSLNAMLSSFKTPPDQTSQTRESSSASTS